MCTDFEVTFWCRTWFRNKQRNSYFPTWNIIFIFKSFWIFLFSQIVCEPCMKDFTDNSPPLHYCEHINFASTYMANIDSLAIKWLHTIVFSSVSMAILLPFTSSSYTTLSCPIPRIYKVNTTVVHTTRHNSERNTVLVFKYFFVLL